MTLELIDDEPIELEITGGDPVIDLDCQGIQGLAGPTGPIGPRGADGAPFLTDQTNSNRTAIIQLNDDDLYLITQILPDPTITRKIIDDTNLDWSLILNKPTEFTPVSHTHTLSQISNLGAGVATALAIAVGGVGGPVVKNGDIGDAIGGSLTLSGAVRIQNAANSTRAFNVVTVAGSEVLAVDTTNRILIAGTDAFAVKATGKGTYLASDGFLCAVAGTSASLNSQDTTLSRQSAGVWQLGTTSSNALGSLACANIVSVVATGDNLRVTGGAGNTWAFTGEADRVSIIDRTAGARTAWRLNSGAGWTFAGSSHSFRDATNANYAPILASNATLSGTVFTNAITGAVAGDVIIQPVTSGSVRINGYGGVGRPAAIWTDAAGGINSNYYVGNSCTGVFNLGSNAGVHIWDGSNYVFSTYMNGAIRRVGIVSIPTAGVACTIGTPEASYVTLRLNQHATTPGNFLECRTSTPTTVFSISSAGNVTASGLVNASRYFTLVGGYYAFLSATNMYSPSDGIIQMRDSTNALCELQAGRIVNTPAASVTLTVNGMFSVEATSNTSLTLKYRGSDGVTRSSVIPIA